MKDKKRFWMPARRRHATQFLHGAAELLLWVLMIGYIFLIVAACNFMAEILLLFPVNNSIECNCFVNALLANCRRGGLNKGGVVATPHFLCPYLLLWNFFKFR